MSHYNKGLLCTAGCGKAITWTTPSGKGEKHDEQGRCPKCSLKDEPTIPWRANQFKQHGAIG